MKKPPEGGFGGSLMARGVIDQSPGDFILLEFIV